MQKNNKLEIRRVQVEEWRGLQEGARRLGVSATQLRRHITGSEPSRRLAKRLEQANIVVCAH